MSKAERRNTERQQTQNLPYTQDYLKTKIGKTVKIDFLIGTNTYQDRNGILQQVGIDYVILKDSDGSLLLGDLYAIKFVTVY